MLHISKVDDVDPGINRKMHIVIILSIYLFIYKAKPAVDHHVEMAFVFFFLTDEL